MSEVQREGDALRPSRSIFAPAYVFICCFLAGPAFGVLAIYAAYWPYGGFTPSLDAAISTYTFALIFGGIQGYRAGVRLTERLDSSGYIPFKHILETTARVAFTPSALLAILGFVRAWAAHDLKGLLVWPIQAFAISFSIHAFAALGVSALIFPLMRRPKDRLPAQ